MILFSIQQADSGGDWQIGKLEIQHRFRQQILEANGFRLWRAALNHEPLQSLAERCHKFRVTFAPATKSLANLA